MSDASSEHLDLDALAELEEGLVEPHAADVARAHVEACEQCRGEVSRLRTTRALLSALPPEPMPVDVAARIDAALASADGVESGTIVPLSARKRSWNTPAIAGTVAAAAVVFLVAAIVAGTLVHGGKKNNQNTGSTAAAPSLGKSAPANTKEWFTGTNYTASTIATLVPKLVTQIPPTPSPSTFGGTNGGLAAGGPAQATTPKSTAGAATTPSYTQEQLRTSPAAILACGQILAGGVPTTPVAVDFARYDGKPAVVFVLPAVGHATTKLDVWVVRSTCSASSFDLPLFRVDRP